MISLGQCVFDQKRGFLSFQLGRVVELSSYLKRQLYQLESQLLLACLTANLSVGLSEILSTYSLTLAILCQSQISSSSSQIYCLIFPQFALLLIPSDTSKICQIFSACYTTLSMTALLKFILGRKSTSSTHGFSLTRSSWLWTGDLSIQKQQSSFQCLENSLFWRLSRSVISFRSWRWLLLLQVQYSTNAWYNLYLSPFRLAESMVRILLLLSCASTNLFTNSSLRAAKALLGILSWIQLEFRQTNGWLFLRWVLLEEQAAVETALVFSFLLKPSLILNELVARSRLCRSVKMLFFSLQLSLGTNPTASSLFLPSVTHSHLTGVSSFVIPLTSINLFKLAVQLFPLIPFMSYQYY